MNARIPMTIAGLTTMGALSLPASGAISTVSGLVTQIGAPLSCTLGALTGPTAYAWDELQGFAAATLPVDMVNFPGSSNVGPIAGALSGIYDSQFLHLDHLSGIPSATGSITFNGVIVGLMFNATSLDNTDLFPGAPGTTYPTGYTWRGLNTFIPSFVTVSGSTMTFNLNTNGPVIELAEVRVITQRVPAPGAASLLGLGALLAVRRRR